MKPLCNIQHNRHHFRKCNLPRLKASNIFPQIASQKFSDKKRIWRIRNAVLNQLNNILVIESLQKFAFLSKFVNNKLKVLTVKKTVMKHFHRYRFVAQRCFKNSSIAPTADLRAKGQNFPFLICLHFGIQWPFILFADVRARRKRSSKAREPANDFFLHTTWRRRC